MESTLESIRKAAERLGGIGESREELAARARRLADRIGAEAFHLAVLGEFKRGKSTLINALIEKPLLPTGVIPLTAVPTEVHYGSPGMTVSFLDGRSERVQPDRLADFVTEAKNPGNQQRVERVAVTIEAPLLRPGVVLVDTPGVASVHSHNTLIALEALKETDGAVVLLSVDSPVSEYDKEILALLRERGTRIFVVINKVDHMSLSEMAQVRHFMEAQVTDILGSSARIFFLAARPALDCILDGRISEKGSGEFEDFRSSLESFVRDELVEARIEAARRELARLGTDLQDSIMLEAAASELGRETLRKRVEEFRGAASHEKRAQVEDQVLLDHSVGQLKDEIAKRLMRHSTKAPEKFFSRLEGTAAATRKRQLEDALHEEVECCVREGFEELRQAEAEQADHAWNALAAEFRTRTQRRVDAVRQAAADLFEVHLPDVTIPAVAEERERFFYIFVHVEGLGSGINRFAQLLLPRPLFRRRALDRAEQRLRMEFDKHAGRARWDLTQRLDQVRLRFEAAMRTEVEQAEETILSAATRAEALLTSSVADLEVELARRESLSHLTQEVRSIAGDHD
jgi:signal recognition particle receptor subunit beta